MSLTSRIVIGFVIGAVLYKALLYYGEQANTRYREGHASPEVYSQRQQRSAPVPNVQGYSTDATLSECDPSYKFVPGLKPGRYVAPGDNPRFDDVKLDPRATGECDQNPNFYGWHQRPVETHGALGDMNPNPTYTCWTPQQRQSYYDSHQGNADLRDIFPACS